MPDMTLREALETDEVQSFLTTKIQESVDELLPAAVEAELEKRMPAIRESVREEVGKDGQVRSLHMAAAQLIEAAPLPPAAKANLLEDYGLVESDDDDTVVPGRALRLIEAEVDADGKVTKPAKTVLREAIDDDVKRVRNTLRESAPSVPRAPGGGGPAGETPAPRAFLGDDSPVAARMREKGLDPALFGSTPKPEPATKA